MGRDPDDSDTVELAKGAVLELLGDSPGDEVSRGAEAALQLFRNRLAADLAFKTDLDSAEDVWQLALGSRLV